MGKQNQGPITNEEVMADLERIKKRNRRITLACGIAGGVIGVGVGACSQVVTSKLLEALIQPANIDDKTWRTITKVGCYGISSTVGAKVMATTAEPFAAIAELLKEEPDYEEYVSKLAEDILAKRQGNEEDDD